VKDTVKTTRVAGFLTIVCEKCTYARIVANLTYLGEIESYSLQESLFLTVIPGYFLIFP